MQSTGDVTLSQVPRSTKFLSAAAIGITSVILFRMKIIYVPALALAIGGASLISAHAAGKHDLELKACGPPEKTVNYSEKTDESQHPGPQPQPAPGKALVYVMRPTMIGMLYQTKLAVDGDWKGVNKGDSYFYFQLDPGPHAFCSIAENVSILQLTVEAGKTYYLQQHIQMGITMPRNQLSLMPEKEGEKKLPELYLATWKVLN